MVRTVVGLALLAGCATTGTLDNSLSSTEPTVFRFAEAPDQVRTVIVRELVRAGFSLATDDTEAGVLITLPKPLENDEKIRVLGVSAAQQGALGFIIQPTAEGTRVEMTARATISVETTTESAVLKQGHPLPMKFRLRFQDLGAAVE